MKRLRGKLTYANVISTLCLFLLLGGGAAFAATQLPKNSVGARQLKRGAVTPAKVSNATMQTLTGAQGPKGETGAPATALWAVVDGNPTVPTFVAKSPAAISVERDGFPAGIYTVNFDRNVTNCAYSVTPVDTITMVSAASVALDEGKPNGVGIQFNEWSDTGEPPFRDTQFSIAVFC